MRKDVLVLSIIVLVLGLLLVFAPEEARIRVEFLPLSTIGILLGIIGIVALLLTVLLGLMADRL